MTYYTEGYVKEFTIESNNRVTGIIIDVAATFKFDREGDECVLFAADKEFCPVMHCRRILDAAAALHFLVGGHWAACWAVVRAHYDFHRMRKDFKADRERNLAATIVPAKQILSPINLLWQYYARGRHLFSELPLGNNQEISDKNI